MNDIAPTARAVSGGPHAQRNRLKGIARRAMEQRGLLPEFSAEVRAELAVMTHAATDSGVQDLRALPWVSIDNDDSRDLDQLSVALPAGEATTMLVAIADVDALVKQGSAIDEHARTNTTSVYTAAQIFPMLPEKLSTDLTSLGPKQDRLAVVVEMKVGADGQLLDTKLYRALVMNHAKLAYNGVAAWLEGTGGPPAPLRDAPELQAQLRLQDRVAQTLKTRRETGGALKLQTIEAHAVFEGEALVGLQSAMKNRATELIEELMVAANGVTARYLDAKGLPSLRRVLKRPERWPRIMELAATLNETLPSTPDAAALETFLLKQQRVDAAHFPDLSLAIVKLLGRGEYALQLPQQAPAGHFALAVSEYTHSTAPNRRFPDVITQRIVKAALAGQPTPYSELELSLLATKCTAQEDNATKVERLVRKSAAALLLGARIGQRFEGIVTGASAKGTWVRLLELPAEGKVVEGFAGFDVGDRVHVELLRVDVERGFIDFAGLKRR